MKMMGVSVLLDTNILLRYLNRGLPQHDAIQPRVAKLIDDDATLWISRQIIREYLVQVTRPGFLATPLPVDAILDQMEAIQRVFQIADDTDLVTRQLLMLIRQYPTGGKQIHDANLVATMLAYQIDTLFTLNLADLQRFGDRITLMTI
jgi:predicted nucleic acid-binding protein